MTGFRLVTANDLCAGAETILKAQLFPLVQALGLDEAGFKTVTTWQQVPDLKALSTAAFPAGAITSPGLADKPVRRAGTYDTYDAVWRVAIGVYDRGRDHAETADRCRTWAALVRAVVLNNTSLGGLATSMRWVGEELRQRPEQSAARTLGGCAVAFDIGASNVVDLSALDPSVLTAQTSLDVQQPQE